MCSDLNDLINKLRSLFEDDHVNVEAVMDLLSSYKSNRADWRKYAIFDPHKSYTRNLVDKGNGKYNLMVLCWGESRGSVIHDHSDSHCFVNVLEGTMKETLYEWPKGGDSMVVKNVNVYETNRVSYMSDKLGLHRMENPSHSDVAVTLHCYIPGFDECNVFDERTGHKCKSKMTLWSKYGQKVDNKANNQEKKSETSNSAIEAVLTNQLVSFK